MKLRKHNGREIHLYRVMCSAETYVLAESTDEAKHIARTHIDADLTDENFSANKVGCKHRPRRDWAESIPWGSGVVGRYDLNVSRILALMAEPDGEKP